MKTDRRPFLTGSLADKAYSDFGGYEQTESFFDPSEKLLKEALARLLTDTESQLR